jgi:hypothetical protein
MDNDIWLDVDWLIGSHFKAFVTPFDLSLYLVKVDKFLLEKVQEKLTYWLMVKLSTSRKESNGQ